MSHTLLVVEDDQAIREYVKSVLLDEGLSVFTAETGIAALELLQTKTFDLVLLDLHLPDMQGESICQRIKQDTPQTKVVFLTAKSGIQEKVQGFNLGADDYITKPFAPEELVARVKARLRSQGQEVHKLSVADLELDSQTVEVTRGGKPVPLTPQEFKLLEYLLQNQGKVLSRDMILNRVWAYSFDVESRVVDVYIGYLRKKIDSDNPVKLIHSVRGFGYTIKA